MKIPPGCRAWADVMESADDERKIVANLRADPCVVADVSEEFFNLIAAGPAPPNAKAAREQACRIVRDQPNKFACTGEHVPDDAFSTLFRMAGVPSLWYTVPTAVLATYGIEPELPKKEDEILDISDTDVELLIDNYPGPLELGNYLHIVWGTDYNDVEPLSKDVSSLSDRLGLVAADRWIIYVYERDATGRSLHVPRALDALNHPGFAVDPDCSATHGRTRPRTGPDSTGFPEAVHRDCSVKPINWELRKVT